MGRSSLALGLVALAFAGCGADEERAAPTTATVAAPPERCVAAGSPGFRMCQYAGDGPARTPATIERRVGATWRVVVAGPPGSVHDGMQIGHWADAWLSPDGETVLAQWSAECEIPIAFFVDVERGSMRPVTGEKRWTNAAESVALGWASDGRARVRFPKGACGRAHARPGVYLIDPASGELTRVAAARG